MAETPAVATPPSAPAAPRPGMQLDDLMLAMDVVDTLRHQDVLVGRELDQDQRNAELIERLRRLYRGQGIEVPDRVLMEGVSALEESRFVYTPPKPGLARSLATLWVRRGQIGKRVLGVLAVVVLGAGVYYAAVVRPEQQRVDAARAATEQERVDLAERLPRALQQTFSDATAAANVQDARARADHLLADGRAALSPGAATAIEQLEALRADLRREYALRIVSRPGEPSGVWRTPGRNPSARNYYLIVEPIGPDGRCSAERGGSRDPHGLALGHPGEPAGLRPDALGQERRRHPPAQHGGREEAGRARRRLRRAGPRRQHSAVVT